MGTPKVIKIDNMLFGPSGIARIIQALINHLKIIKQKKSENDYEYLLNKVKEPIRMLSHKYNLLDSDGKLDGTIVIGYNKNLYKLFFDFTLATCSDFIAGGSAWKVATGAMVALPLQMDPIKKITKALEISEKYNSGVRGPFHILSI